jgi:hypothetical protein
VDGKLLTENIRIGGGVIVRWTNRMINKIVKIREG